MGELINNFSWSISARDDFNECRRRRYWAKYAMWNGWKENASPIQRAAYRLSKMENRFTLLGNAVELGVNWLIRSQQAGRAATAEEAYEAAAKPFLNKCWSESVKGQWKNSPKKFCCLHEHYYSDLGKNREKEKELTAEMIVRIKLCLSNFITKVLAGLAPVKKEQEIAISTVAVGDPESFVIDETQTSAVAPPASQCETLRAGQRAMADKSPEASPGRVKIYAIPDYAYLKEGKMHIHDWKSGRQKPAHKDQMAVYGLWAASKHKFDPQQVHIHLEYLSAGITDSTELTNASLLLAQELIRDSVAEMAEYLVDGDLNRNEPLPKEDWEMSADMNVCRKCNFYELCKSEQEG
ncbi:MAG: PD-(D/E)XK nuclease family protein [Kiritimatiellia bacterium]|nr:PD-(D/E)XK nuclease family protein [Kiritimatiellia bacterium]